MPLQPSLPVSTLKTPFIKGTLILMKIILFFLLIVLSVDSSCQIFSNAFELRYFSSDPKANGETDFKGETEWMNTEQRVSFLNDYADFGSRYFSNPSLDKEIVSDEEVERLINEIKPQPTTNIRRTIILNGWKAYGYKGGQNALKEEAIKYWKKDPGVKVTDGELEINNTTIEKSIKPLNWRFKIESNIRLIGNARFSIKLKDGDKTAISLVLDRRTYAAEMNDGSDLLSENGMEGVKLVIEGDMTQKRFNCYIDDTLIEDYTIMVDTSASAISTLWMESSGASFLDDLFIFNHTPGNNKNYPYFSKVILDENFESKPAPDGWQELAFNDSHWVQTDLPAVHGGLREKEENFYLRKKISVEDFESAFLQLEAVDPGGEVWVNNEVVAVINDRHPYEIDITKYLKKNKDNLIAIKVKPYKLNFPMPHTPTDPYIGWFLGRAQLLLTSKCVIKNVGITTEKIGQDALQLHNVIIQYPDRDFFQGTIEINYYPWFPKEGAKVASFTAEIKVRPRIENQFQFEFPVHFPQLWTSDSPTLYKVEIILKDNEGKPIDDYVTTTGIRVIEQREGTLYVNGKPEMLNGAQIMGFRTPIETTSKYHRSAPIETVAEEMLMIKKMGANLLRVHVHAEKDTVDGINDPRYAEFADQMGVYLIWQTAGFMREGEAWNIDFEGYPKYMRQVFNHPSIVMWEASNHPNEFKQHDISETHDFVEKIYQTIYSVDQSRLISPTSSWKHTHYANYNGTRDYQGNVITAVPEFNAVMNTRGSQDAYTGYGADWSKLRKAPDSWAASNLEANEKAYFNFEHEESIGQPNWSLEKGKPWYLIHSYEWGYDEGSIGRRLTTDEWRTSQAWQAFSAWESMKKQMLLGYDGFSWCTIRGGANMGTYQKPLIDNSRHPKLAYYTNHMVFQRTWAASNNVDVVYGPDDLITPVIHHIGEKHQVDLIIELKDLDGKIVDKKVFRNVGLTEGRSYQEVNGFSFKKVKDGVYAIEYHIRDSKRK